MSYNLIKLLIALTLNALLASCSTSSALYHTSPLAPGLTKEWSTKLAGGPGKIEIQLKLEPHSNVDISFGGPDTDKFDAIRINLNDHNCNTGHEASIAYSNNKGEFYTAYFEKPSPWNSLTSFIISWDKDKLSISFNGELIEVSSGRRFSALSIFSHRRPIDIQKIFYTP